LQTKHKLKFLTQFYIQRTKRKRKYIHTLIIDLTM